MILRSSRILFLLAVALLPVAQLPLTAISRYPVQIGDLFMIGALLTWIAALTIGRTSLKTDRIFIFIAIYGLALAASIPGSENPSLSILKFGGELYLFTTAFISYQLISYEDDMLRKTLLAWTFGVGLTVIFSMVAVALFYTGYDTQEMNPLLSHFGSLPAGDYPRIRSIFANANMMANYMNIGIPLIVAAAARGWLSLPVKRIVSYGAWGSAFLTLSPGFGGILLSAALQRLRSSARYAKLLLGAGVIAALGFFAAATVSPDTKNTYVGTTVLGTTIEPSVRMLVWRSSLEAIMRNPFFGRGVGIDPATVTYEAVNGDLQYLRDAHNMLLNVAGQSGLIGLAALLALLIHVYSRLRRAEPRDAVVTALWAAFIGAVVYQGLTGSFENARHVWVMFGMIAVATHFKDHAAEPEGAGQ